MSEGSSQARKISAQAVITDIRLGLPDTQLMAKYNISLKTLRDFYRKLEIAKLRCPSCGETRWKKFDECPSCGIILDKFGKDLIVKGPTKGGTVPIVVSGETTDPFRGRSRVIGIAAAVIGVALLVGVGLFFRSSAQSLQDDIYYGPIRQEIVKIQRKLSHGLTLEEHRTTHNQFIDAISKLQARLKGRNAALIAALDRAASALNGAENAWRLEIGCATEAMKSGWKNPDDLLNAIRQAKAKGQSTDKIDDLHSRWSGAQEARQEAWNDFKAGCGEAEQLMQRQ